MSNHIRFRFQLTILSILALQWATAAEAGVSSVIPPRFIRDTNLTQSLVALVSFNTSPGITNANYKISWPPDQPVAEASKSTLEIGFNIDRPGRFIKPYVALAFSDIDFNDIFVTTNTDGDPIVVNPERELRSIRLSGGLTFQMSPRFTLKPYVSYIYSELESKANVTGNADLGNIDFEVLKAFLLDFETKSNTFAGTLEAKYDHWFGEGRMELIGLYTYSYTNTFDETFEILDSSGDNNVVVFNARWTAPTGLRPFGVPLRWKVFGGYTDFLDLQKNDLGFTHLFEYGGGFDFEVDSRALGLFNLRNLGIEVSGIVGDNINGWSIGIVIRN